MIGKHHRKPGRTLDHCDLQRLHRQMQFVGYIRYHGTRYSLVGLAALSLAKTNK